MEVGAKSRLSLVVIGTINNPRLHVLRQFFCTAPCMQAQRQRRSLQKMETKIWRYSYAPYGWLFGDTNVLSTDYSCKELPAISYPYQ